MNSDLSFPEVGQFLLFQTETGDARVEVLLYNENVWLTSNQMAELFRIDKSGISRHLKNIFDSSELQRDATVAKFATVQMEGKRSLSRDLEYYNLDAIISVGYRVNTVRGTQFRIWASQRLREYLIKGFCLDDQRLKQEGKNSYFEELLSRIRDIRSSEKVFWRKVLDIYATSIDYDPNTVDSKEFFKVVQNKMHWAAHGHTAAEIIYERVDANKSQLGMTNWESSSPKKAEVGMALLRNSARAV
jgi:hypothetical protein